MTRVKAERINGVVPPASDPRWAVWCAPLAEFLEKPRSFKELDQWVHTHKVGKYMLPQMLAWLELQHRAFFYKGKWAGTQDRRSEG